MIPKRIESEKEQQFNLKIEDVQKLFDKDYVQSGSADKALNQLKKILDELKE